MDEHYHLPLDLDQISKQANFSRYHFIRLFKQAFHQTPHQYLTYRRIETAKALLRADDLTVTEVCFAVGFESLGSFSALFCRYVGQPPRVYRARLTERQRHPHNVVPACFMMVLGLTSTQQS
jgi:AraC-like DNA-binding protein